jgi:hypothetical protein
VIAGSNVRDVADDVAIRGHYWGKVVLLVGGLFQVHVVQAEYVFYILTLLFMGELLRVVAGIVQALHGAVPDGAGMTQTVCTSVAFKGANVAFAVAGVQPGLFVGGQVDT